MLNKEEKDNFAKFSEEAWKRVNLEIQRARVTNYAKKAAEAKTSRAFKKYVLKLHKAIKKELFYEEQLNTCQYCDEKD